MESCQQNQARSKSTKINKRLKRKLHTEKQNGFVLDCLNEKKSQLKTYNSVGDKFLNYFVIRVHPNMAKPFKKSQSVNNVSKVRKIESVEQVNHSKFSAMLKRRKEQIVSTSRGCFSQAEENSCDEVVEAKGSKGEIIKIEDDGSSAIKYRQKQKTIEQAPNEQQQAEVEVIPSQQ